MATLVLGAIGNTLFPGVGGFIGAALGGVIDNALIFPLLFPQEPISGQRLQGVQFGGAAEGEPIQWALGPHVRLPGTPIYLSDYEEVEETYRVGKGGGGSSNSYSYYCTVAIAVAEANDPQAYNRLRKIFGDAKILYDDGTVAKYDSLTFYDGSQTTPDPTLEAALGAGNVPAFKNIAYFVIERLFITEYGNRPPNINVKLEQDYDVSVQEVLNAIVQRYDLSTSDIDATRVPFCFKGMSVAGPQSGIDVLEAVLATYALVAQEADGKIKFHPRGSEVVISVDEAELGTGSNPGLSVVDHSEFVVPREYEVRFVNEEDDCQPGDIPYINPNGSSEQDKTTFATPLTLNPAEARALGKRLLWASIAERESVSLVLPPSYSHLVAGDALSFTSNGRSLRVFCRQVDIGSNYEVKVQGHVMDADVYEQTGIGQLGYGSNDGYTPPELKAIILDMAPLSRSAAEAQGVHWATVPNPASDPLTVADLYTSLDDTTYDRNGSVTVKATTGTVIEGLDPSRNGTEMDGGSRLVVQLDRGSLSSASLSDLLNGRANIAAVETGLDLVTGVRKWEIIGFQTVTDHGDGEYALTDIYRGLRGTEHNIPLALPYGGRFVLLENNGAIRFFDGGPDYTEAPEAYFKVVAVGQEVSAAPTTVRKIYGQSSRCFSPTHMRASKEYAATDDVRFSWERRTKLPAFESAFVDGPSYTDDETNEFLVEMRMNRGEEAPLLFSEVVEGSTWLLTESMRNSIASSNGYSWNATDRFYVWVRQISTLSGPGERSAPYEIPEFWF